MNSKFVTPGVIILFCAFVLSFLVSISLPFFTGVDIVRVHLGTGQDRVIFGSTQIRRHSLRAFCGYDVSGHRQCSPRGHGYAFQVINFVKNIVGTVSASWTRGLAVHPVATAVTFGALVLSFTAHTLITFMVSFLAALLTLIAFAIDIALFALVDHEMKKVQLEANTNTAPGFWMTFVALVLLIVAPCAVFLGHRNRSSGDSSIPMTSAKEFFSRFKS
ncbi:hypothetical protein CVT26_000505 [Gymnopilus dilepis]|uniref:Pali-domain-containing protein n=1 Tax=Gymnopilus dilepis TaxID=231916 RepID=A0A409VH12_9AGAR|nr:hypothetical protein CVT26_000505 [Gymnopilus dilepis]